MPTVRVSKSDKSQKGKPRVFFDGREGWADAYYLGARVEAPPVGAMIDAQTSSKTFEDGKTIWFLNGWKPVNQQAETAQVVEKANGKETVRAVVIGWPIEAHDASVLLATIVKAVIDGGLVKEPNDLAPWYAAHYHYLNGLRAGKPIEFDDKFTFPDEEVTVTNGEPGDDVSF